MNKHVSRLVLTVSTFASMWATSARAAEQEPDATVAARPSTPHELNFNFFRNPSTGLEYRWGDFALHGGAYPTIISQNTAGENETSWFLRAGVTTFFLGHSWNGQRPSEFFVSASYLRGLNLGRKHAALTELGYRWMVWRGLNLRIGVAVLMERGREVKVNPTPGIGWSHAL